MSKYDPLHEYICKQSLHQFVLSFAEIETIIDNHLPPNAARPQWWENATDLNSSHVQYSAGHGEPQATMHF